MSIDRSTIYFSVRAHRTPGSLLVEFRHCATALVLTMEEALLVEGLPEQLTLQANPSLPGRAAWVTKMPMLPLAMAMRRAGFAASAAEAATGPTAPPPPPVREQPTIIQLAPGVVMDMSGMMPRPQSDAPEEIEDLAFNTRIYTEDGKPVVYVNFATLNPDDPDGLDDPEEVTASELEGSTIWPQIKHILARSPTDRHSLISAMDEAATIAALTAAGIPHCDRIFFCHEPEALEFGVSHDRDSHDEDAYTIFVIPKDHRAPYFDDLRDDHLVEVPPYFADNICENTWELTPDADRDAVIADMIARGYTHNPELDGAKGG